MYQPDRNIVSRGDGFDVPGFQNQQPGFNQQPQGISIGGGQINPLEILNGMDLNQYQAENIRAIIAGAGAGLATKWLSRHIGSSLAAGIGGAVAGMLADKITKGRL